ncbi:flagellar protein FliT [Fredinandcohnia sp. 179-A 10B2 NHS]|uniref:flagellar protein FliT n=1 Tax=Fredinandcohnia sp. 179-A 10B2 NHS TaxID=3235176 RepID=UPI0039A321AE
MNPVVALYRVSKELQSILDQPIEKDSRDEAIEKIALLLGDREQLLPEVKPPFSVEEKKLGAEIIQMNTLIESHLEKIKKDIQFDLAHVKKSKETSNKYANPYQTPPADGMFFDKRK